MSCANGPLVDCKCQRELQKPRAKINRTSAKGTCEMSGPISSFVQAINDFRRNKHCKIAGDLKEILGIFSHKEQISV